MRSRLARARPWLIMALSYLALSLLILRDLFSTGFLHSSEYIEADASFPIWANGWVAHALEHLENPLYSADAWSPHGVNLLANTTSVGLAVVLSPLTWLIGPIGSFNVALILLPVVSALAMCLAVRPWVRSPVAVWLAGLAWGFSPVALEALTWGWPNFLYLATAPLLFWILSDLLHFQRRSPRTLGILLSVVLTVQFTIGTEIFAMDVVVTAVVLVALLAVTAAINRPVAFARLRRAGVAARWAVPLIVLVLVPLVLFSVLGPAHLPNWVFPEWLFRRSHLTFANLLRQPTANGTLIAHLALTSPSHLYFGGSLLVCAGVVAVVRWRRILTGVLAGTAILCTWLAFGSHAVLSPWTLLWKLPAIHNIFASRFVELTWFPVIFLVALGFDALLAWISARHPTRAARSLAALFPLAALVPLAVTAGGALHLNAWRSTPDRAVPTLAASGTDPRLLTFPFPAAGRSLLQQASSSFNYQLVGGWGPEGPSSSPRERAVLTDLANLTGYGVSQLSSAQLALVGAQLRAWHVDDAVVPVALPFPNRHGFTTPAHLTETLTELYGPPETISGEYVWPIGNRSFSTRTISATQSRRCDESPATPADNVVACVERALSNPPSHRSG